MEMREVHAQVIPHASQRYPTVGDWERLLDGVWLFKISQMGDWRYHFLVLFHEMVEMALCVQHKVSEESVTEFDCAFEVNRSPGSIDEPGDDPKAPYYVEHRIATQMERAMASALDVDWDAYEQAVSAL